MPGGSPGGTTAETVAPLMNTGRASGRMRGVSEGTRMYTRGVDAKPLPWRTIGVLPPVQPKGGVTPVMVIAGASVIE